MDHILSIVLFTPLVGGLVLALIPASNEKAVRWWANIVAFIGFLVSLPLVFQFDRTKDFQFVEKASWIPSIGAGYHLGIDGLGLLLVMLTTVVGFLSILASWKPWCRLCTPGLRLREPSGDHPPMHGTQAQSAAESRPAREQQVIRLDRLLAALPCLAGGGLERLLSLLGEPVQSHRA